MLSILACVAITAWFCRAEIRMTRRLFSKTKKLFCRACDEEITYNPDNEPLGRGAMSCRTCYVAIEADLQKMLPEWYTGSCPPEVKTRETPIDLEKREREADARKQGYVPESASDSEIESYFCNSCHKRLAWPSHKYGRCEICRTNNRWPEGRLVRARLEEIERRSIPPNSLPLRVHPCQQCGAPPNEDCKCSYRDATVAKCERCWANRFDVSPASMYCWSCLHGNPSGPGTSVEVFHLHTGREVTVVKHKCTKCKVNLIEAEIPSGRCMKCSAESWSDQILDVYSPPVPASDTPLDRALERALARW